MKKILLIILAIIILIYIVFPKVFDMSGGLAGSQFKNDEKCIGYTFDYEREFCNDCFVKRYCVGLPVSK